MVQNNKYMIHNPLLVLELGADFLMFETEIEQCLVHCPLEKTWSGEQHRKILKPFHPITLSL